MSKFQRVIAARWVKSLWLVALLLALTLGQRAGHAAEMRFALVIGNDEYKSTKLATPANDAGLVANALTAAGFTVTGARNLDQATLRESVREFLGQVAAAGPDAVAVIYLAGFGVQFAGENYYVPVDADLARDVDVPLQAVRISDFAQPLAALPAGVKIVILDAARQSPFAQGGEPLASGLALVDPAPGMAIAFNAAPGTIGPEEPGPYGAYATALTEMIAAGGLSLDDVFARVRLRVSEVTNGGEVPWYASQINTPFFFTERSADAPPPPDVAPVVDLREKPMRSYSSVEDAYAAALALDTIDGYEQFLALHPRSRYARRIAAMIAVRREEIIWRRCVFDNTPPAYWSYLRRYPNGPHVWDARRRLAMIGAQLEGPPDFAFIDFGVPPPPPEELVVVDRPVVTFWGGDYEPPPPPPVFFLPPRPREFVVLPPPPPPRERYFLPTPQAVVVPAFVRPPPTVVVVQPAPATRTAPGPTPVALPAVVSRGRGRRRPRLSWRCSWHPSRCGWCAGRAPRSSRRAATSCAPASECSRNAGTAASACSGFGANAGHGQTRRSAARTRLGAGHGQTRRAASAATGSSSSRDDQTSAGASTAAAGPSPRDDQTSAAASTTAAGSSSGDGQTGDSTAATAAACSGARNNQTGGSSTAAASATTAAPRDACSGDNQTGGSSATTAATSTAAAHSAAGARSG